MPSRFPRTTLQQLADGLAADLGGGLAPTWSPFVPRLQAAALLPALRVRAALACANPVQARRAWATAREAAESLQTLLDLGRRCGLVGDELTARAARLRDALAALSGEGLVAGLRV
jgi:plasmid stabilization system protein ParE